jgi:hypothetical protein
VTAASASSAGAVEAARDETAARLWRPWLTFPVYLLTGSLYGVWWFFVTRREMAAERGEDVSPARSAVEAILQLIPVVNAYFWYRLLADMNSLRERVGAPKVNATMYAVVLALPVPCIYVLPEVLGPALDAFNPDMREIIRAIGYATVPAVPITFGFAMGYWNEYWMEKTGDRATWRRPGPVDVAFGVLALASIVFLISRIAA